MNHTDKFLLASKCKNLIIKTNNILSNVPRCDYFYKDKLNNYTLALLDEIYLANESITELETRLANINRNIAMIDFLLERFYLKHYFNDNQVQKVCDILIEIKKMSNVWLKKRIEATDVN